MMLTVSECLIQLTCYRESCSKSAVSVPLECICSMKYYGDPAVQHMFIVYRNSGGLVTCGGVGGARRHCCLQ